MDHCKLRTKIARVKHWSKSFKWGKSLSGTNVSTNMLITEIAMAFDQMCPVIIRKKTKSNC